MAIIGFISAFVVLAVLSLTVLFFLCFGGEEFSPARGGALAILATQAVIIGLGWYWWWQSAPFTLHWK